MNKKNLSASLAGDVCLGGELSVHRLGFGAMRLTGEGVWGPPTDRKAALAVLRKAVEMEVNFIDTADSYGPQISGPMTQLRPTCAKRLKAASKDCGLIASTFISCTCRIRSSPSSPRWRLWRSC